MCSKNKSTVPRLFASTRKLGQGKGKRNLLFQPNEPTEFSKIEDLKLPEMPLQTINKIEEFRVYQDPNANFEDVMAREDH
jgi:hypothetical protein